MKYYEYNEPYYGLVKAETLEQSVELYTKDIADPSEMPIEISEKDALLAYLHGDIEGDSISAHELVELVNEFYEDGPGVLLVDGSLL